MQIDTFTGMMTTTSGNDECPPLDVIDIKTSRESFESNTSFQNAPDKTTVIRDCLGYATIDQRRQQQQSQPLSKSDKTAIDLWQLRQLALSRSGLINSQWRAKAWPLLMGISTAQSSDDEVEEEQAVVIDNNQAMEEDINAAISCWNVHCNTSEKSTTKELEQQENDDEGIPGLALSSPSFTSALSSGESFQDEEDHSNDNPNKNDASELVDPVKICSINDQQVPTEKLLKQLLTQVFVKSHSARKEHTQELVHVALLIQTNLCSSLASRVLARVFKYPLYAAFFLPVEDQNLLRSILQSKLGVTSNGNHHKLFASIMTHSSTSKTTMIRAANRILDACMASHPLFLVYLQLALYENFSKKDGIMDQVEDAITLTIAYMQECPPVQLLEASQIALPAAPAWTAAVSAPLDWVHLPTQKHQTVEEESAPVATSVFTQQQQQEVPFKDDMSEANWESMSVAESKGATIATQEVQGGQEYNITTTKKVSNEKANMFYQAYPLAMIAAGLITDTNLKTQPTPATQKASLYVATTLVLMMHLALTGQMGKVFSSPAFMKNQSSALSISSRTAVPSAVVEISASMAPSRLVSNPQKMKSRPMINNSSSYRTEESSTLPLQSPIALPSAVVESKAPSMLMSNTQTKSQSMISSNNAAIKSAIVVKESAVVSPALEARPSAVGASQQHQALAPPTPISKSTILKPVVRQLRKLQKLWKKVASVLFRHRGSEN